MEALLLAFLVLFSLSISNTSLANNLVSKTQSLKSGDTLVSKGGIFEMGFFSPTNSLNRYIGIWYRQDPKKTVVWVANRDHPLTNTSSAALKITLEGQLALVGDNNHAVWSANSSRSVQNPVAELLDSGNFVVREADDENPENFLWQSFDYPTDHNLPGMKIGWNFQTGHEVFITAWKSQDDPASGQYTLHLDPSGYPQIVIKNGPNRIYASGPWTNLSSSESGGKGSLLPYWLVRNKREVYMTYGLSKAISSLRFVLTSNGLVKGFVWENQTKEWDSFSTTSLDSCDTYGVCGGNGFCNVDGFPTCGCLEKFLPNNNASENLSLGCHRRKPLSCLEDGDSFQIYSGIKLPDTNNSRYFESVINLQECEQICLRNCSCTAYSILSKRNGGIGCLVWFGDLIGIRSVSPNGQDIYIRLASSEVTSGPNHSSSMGRKTKIIVLCLLLPVVIVLLGMLLSWYFCRNKKTEESLEEELELPMFDWSVMLRATNNFSNKIGQGGFGVVYKGVLDGGEEIAVKRLSKNSVQGLREFKNEVSCIAKLQHRNLVKLLGCCISGEEKMLIYEYMPNKSLDFFIFVAMEVLFPVLVLSFLLSIANICLGKDIDLISRTQFLNDGDTIISKGGTFVMGFFSPTNSSSNRYVGIWYKQIPVQTVVWVANRDAPLADTSSSAVLKITLGGQLSLLGDQGQAVWSANTSRSVRNPIAELLDTGNLVVRDADDENPENFLWQSFDHPTDHLLPGMKYGWNLQTGHEVFLTAWKGENDPASGQYTQHLDLTGYPQLILKNGTTEIFSTGPWNGLRFSVSTEEQNSNNLGPHGVVINKKEVYFWYNPRNDLGLFRFVVTSNGFLRAWVWEDQINKWMSYRSQPADICATYGLCGGNGVCNIEQFHGCVCLDKFLPNNNATATGSLSQGCHRRKPLSCHNNGSSSDGFLKYSNIKLPDTKQSWYNESMSLQECEQVCLRNCSCMAYSTLNITNGGSGCLIWYEDLVDMRTVNNGQDLYIRLASSEIPVFAGVYLFVYFCKRKRKEQKLKQELELPIFDWSTISRVTNNFSEMNKLGQGGFGVVYKGTLDGGEEIAVKRLSKNSKQGLEEFKNEVICIAKLQHRNLVKLLGCCIRGEEKMLIYEYMPNKSLDFFIFVAMEVLFQVFVLSFLLSIANICLGKDIDLISRTQFLKDGDTIISQGGTFVMGFFSPTNSSNRYVGIWYKQIPVQTVVWVANRDAPLADTSSSAVLKITLGGQLSLLGDQGQAVWSANTSRSVRNPVAELLDTGNLVVRDADDENPENFLWQSFDYPTDHWLPGMKVGWNLQTGHEVFLTAWKGENDPASGQYTLHLDPAGYPQLSLRNRTAEIFSSGPWNGLYFSVTSVDPSIRSSIYEPHGQVINNKKEVYFWVNPSNDLGLIRFLVTSNGIIKSWVWEDEINQWVSYRSYPSDICGTYGLCGGNGVCNIQQFHGCVCLDKFLPNNNATATGSLSRGCHRRKPLSCHNNGSSSDGFLKYSNIKLPDTKQSWYNESMSLQECEQVCLRNCSCMAYSTLNISNGGSGCLIWYKDLVDMRTIQNGQDLYIRLASSEIPGLKPEPHHSSSLRRKIKILVICLSLLAVIVLAAVYLFFYFYKRKRKEQLLKQELELSIFDWSTISRATNNFSNINKLGQGGFGVVYKGALDWGEEIAVKRLSKNSKQGLEEFKNEVICIAKLQHRNLVKLLGCCISGEEKMLIYEYMPNKSLDFFIFGMIIFSSM
nr:G-type lectin S-receptor-like serine/threonine-protein kinase At4g27290 [Ipomoea trifida]